MASPADLVRRLCLAVALALTAGGSELALAAEIAPPGKGRGADLARVVKVTPVRPRPGSGPLVRMLATQTSWGGGPQQLLVLGAHRADDGTTWLKVRLPSRPNGSVGWISRDAVTLRHEAWWLDISLSRRVVSVYRDGSLVRRIPAVVGAPITPTPTGLFAAYEPVAQPRADGFLGPWVLQLTAFSTVLDNYGGGPGRVAIHGRGGASLADPLGTARSHGCLRVSNASIRWLAQRVVPGTPVLIHR